MLDVIWKGFKATYFFMLQVKLWFRFSRWSWFSLCVWKCMLYYRTTSAVTFGKTEANRVVAGVWMNFRSQTGKLWHLWMKGGCKQRGCWCFHFLYDLAWAPVSKTISLFNLTTQGQWNITQINSLSLGKLTIVMSTECIILHFSVMKIMTKVKEILFVSTM